MSIKPNCPFFQEIVRAGDNPRITDGGHCKVTFSPASSSVQTGFCAAEEGCLSLRVQAPGSTSVATCGPCGLDVEVTKLNPSPPRRRPRP